MAHIASINGSTASPPPSQIATSAPDTAEHGFLSLLTNAATKTSTGSQDAGKLFTSLSAKSVVTQASDIYSGQLSSKIKQLLDKGVSLNKIAQTIASKLVGASDGKHAVDAKKVSAVADYLKSGESDSQDNDTTAKNITAKIKALLAATKSAADDGTTNDSGNILDALQAGETPTTTEQDAPSQTQQASSDTPHAAAPKVDDAAKQAQAPPAAPMIDPALLAAAVQALQAPPKPVDPTASSAPAKAAPAVSITAADTQAPLVQAQVPQAQDPAPEQAPAHSADDTQQAAAASAEMQARQAQMAAGTAIAIQTAAAAPDPTQQQTLGQLAQASLLHVDSDLHAIASGQGTELGRALIRAANVDLTRSTPSTVSQGEQTLAALSASLDELLKTVDPKSSQQQDTPSQQNAFDTSLGGAALGLSSGASSTTAQTAFSGALNRAAAPVHPEEVMEQVVHGLSIKNFASNPTVKISLNPQHLGELDVKLTVTNDSVHASVVAQSHEVRNILLDNKAQLDQALAQAGLKLGSLQVDVNGQNTQQDAERRQTQRDQIFAARQTIAKSDPDTEAPAPSPGPSLLGSVNISLLNQLA